MKDFFFVQDIFMFTYCQFRKFSNIFPNDFYIRMFTIYKAQERRDWQLPCFRMHKHIYLSDSQWRNLNRRNIRRKICFNDESNISYNEFVFYRIDLNHWNKKSNENMVILRGASFPDIMNLLATGFVGRVGSKWIP